MLRSSLTAVLLATQLFSWSAAPLYVCLANDGSVGMHLGATECCTKHEGGCEHSCAAKTVKCKCHHQGAVAHKSHSLAPSVHTTARKSCDCNHIQISQPQLPIVVVKANTTDAEHNIALPLAAISAEAFSAPAATALGLQPTLFIGNASSSLAQLETVALRC